MVTERSYFLHVLRILSATLVCIGHAKEFFITHQSKDDSIFQDLFRGFMSLGGASVLVFFFLSGFLVGGNEITRARQKNLNPRKYLIDRLTRLWIVLIPALLFTSFSNLITCRSKNYSLYCSADQNLASHSSAPPFDDQNIHTFFGNILFLQPFKVNVFAGNGPLWSLSYEFWYYIIFYVILLCIYHKKKIFFSIETIIMILLSVMGAYILSLNWISLSLIWISGALANQLIQKLDLLKFFSNLTFFSTWKIVKLLIFFVFPALISPTLFPRYISYPVIVVLLTASIALTHKGSSMPSKSRVVNFCIKGSEFSFSLYLIHFPILALLSSIFTPIKRWDLDFNSVAFVGLSTLLSMFLAYLFAFLTEFRLQFVRYKLKKLYD